MCPAKTIAQPEGIDGVGLHTGTICRLRLLPASPQAGIVFVRTDLGVEVPARLENVVSTNYSTTLATRGAVVATVEHLLGACVGLGISDLRIELDGPEVPILDGSALPFVRLIQHAGVREQPGAITELRVLDTVRVGDAHRWVELRPAAELTIDYRVAFEAPAVGHQRFIAEAIQSRFERSIAPARTFGFLCEVPVLRHQGLGRGGSLANCVVVDGSRVLSGSLRFRDEFVRHKVLDLVGAIALLEHPLRAHVVACRAGETLHVAALRELLARPSHWELSPFGELASRTVIPYRSESELTSSCAV